MNRESIIEALARAQENQNKIVDPDLIMAMASEIEKLLVRRKILVIWELVPDKMILYLIEPKDEAERKMILLAHGCYLGLYQDDGAARKLNEFLKDKESFYDNENSESGDCPVIGEGVDVVCSGEIL